VSRPVFKTGLAAIAVAGEFDSLPPPPVSRIHSEPEALIRLGPSIPEEYALRPKPDPAAP
jgi:hypothetical protein